MNDKYLPYRIEDLLADDEFIHATLDKEEWNSLLRSYQSQPDIIKRFEDAKAMMVSLRFKEELFSNKDLVWARIDESTTAKEVQMTEETANTSYKWTWIAGAIAAGLALLLTVQSLFPTNDVVSYHDMVNVPSMTLPAGSIVSDISGDLTVDESIWSEERKISLKGTATFEVTKGVPFVVSTPNGSIRVLGTKFTVSSEGSALIVNVAHGKVRVTSGNNSQILTDNMGFRKNAFIKEDMISSQVIYHQYEEASLKDIISVLESSYDIEIILKDQEDLDKTYTGFFDSANLKTALQSVFWPLGLSYNINGKSITISKE